MLENDKGAGPRGGGAADAGVDPLEAAKFARVAAEWWDPDGPLAPLHAMQPVRLDYIRDQAAAAFGIDLSRRDAFSGLRAADLGCGGGLLSEPLARMGAAVVAVDPVPEAIAAASAHAVGGGLAIDYRAMTVDALAAEAAGAFDLVAALEVVEHAPDRAGFIRAAGALVRPGGLLILSTLNRTAASWVGAILVAERALGWLEPGTHSWRAFPTPDELSADVAAAGLRVVDRTGFQYAPLSRRWRRGRDLSINYALTAIR